MDKWRTNIFLAICPFKYPHLHACQAMSFNKHLELFVRFVQK